MQLCTNVLYVTVIFLISILLFLPNKLSYKTTVQSFEQIKKKSTFRGGGCQPPLPLVNHNLCEFSVLKEQPGNAPGASPTYSLFTTVYNRWVYETVHCWSLNRTQSYGNLENYKPARFSPEKIDVLQLREHTSLFFTFRGESREEIEGWIF